MLKTPFVYVELLTLSLVYTKIDALTQEVEAKDAQLNQEKESARVLSKRVQDLQATSSGFEALAAQSEEILNKLGLQNTKADEWHQKSSQEFRDR